MKKIIIPILFLLPLSVFAANPPLSVTFNPNPLFVQGNFMPADEATGMVEVKNLGADAQIVITEAVHVSDPYNLSSQLHLLITKAGGDALYNGSFKTFLTGGEKVLSELPGSSNETYTFIITFNNTDDNSYQGKTLDFNLCVGFQGGQTHCGDTVIGDEEDTGGGDNNDGGGIILGSGGSSSGGGGGSTRHLVITDEQAIPGSGSATITWKTNLLATSQVIYGLASDGPYNINMTVTNFGYPLGTDEDPNKVTNHSVTISLLPGTYVYRVVSRASPATVSYEHEFTVPTYYQTGGAVSGLGTTKPLAEVTGEILGANTDLSDGGNGTSSENILRNNLAATFGAGWFSWWWLWIILLILLALGLYFYRNRRNS